MPTIYNFALCFAQPVHAVLVRYSESVAAAGVADFALGANSIPHLTIVQFEAERDAIEYVVPRLCALVREPVPLQLMGLTFLPTRDGHLWIEINVLKSETLVWLQRAAIELLGDATIHSGIGNAYRPHVTVARLLEQKTVPPIRIAYEIVRHTDVVGHAAVGVSGPQYQLERLLR